MTSPRLRPIYLRTWKTLPGSTPLSQSSALLCGFARQSPDGEANPSLKPWAFRIVFLHLSIANTLLKYKRKSNQLSGYGEPPGSSSLPIESLVHSNPASPTATRKIRRKPSIDMYFVQLTDLPLFREDTWNTNKRMRSPDDGRAGANKRARVP